MFGIQLGQFFGWDRLTKEGAALGEGRARPRADRPPAVVIERAVAHHLKILGLALADAVNPCALAVISFILIAILTKNPGKRKKVLFAGLAFVLAVFILSGCGSKNPGLTSAKIYLGLTPPDYDKATEQLQIA